LDTTKLTGTVHWSLSASQFAVDSLLIVNVNSFLVV
jgi:hypothetical protein